MGTGILHACNHNGLNNHDCKDVTVIVVRRDDNESAAHMQ